MLLIISFIEFTPFWEAYFPAVCPTQIAAVYNISIPTISNLASVNTIGFLICLFITTPLVSLIGLHQTILSLLALQLIGTIITLVSYPQSSFFLLVVGQLFVGIGDLYLSIALLIVRHFPDHLSLAFSFASSIYGVATASSSYLFPWLIASTSFTSVLWLFFGMTVLAIVSHVCFIFIERHAFARYGMYRLRADSHGQPIVTPWTPVFHRARRVAALPDRHTRPVVERVRHFWTAMTAQSWILWVFLALGFVCYACIYGPIWLMPPFISHRFGMDEASAAVVSFGLINALSVFLTPLLGFVFDRHGHRLPIFIACFALCMVSSVLLLWAPVHPALASVFCAPAFSVIRSIGISSLPSIVTPDFVDAASTLYMIWFAIGVIVGDNISAVLAAVHNIAATLYFGLALAAVTIALATVLWWHANDKFQGIARPFCLALPRLLMPMPAAAAAPAPTPPDPAQPLG